MCRLLGVDLLSEVGLCNSRKPLHTGNQKKLFPFWDYIVSLMTSLLGTWHYLRVLIEH
jgi:hypothetical protein